jgi:hypothetical protein
LQTDRTLGTGLAEGAANAERQVIATMHSWADQSKRRFKGCTLRHAQPHTSFSGMRQILLPAVADLARLTTLNPHSPSGPPENKGLHAASFRAALRREGVYASPTAGEVLLNDEMAEPILREIATAWDEVGHMGESAGRQWDVYPGSST